MKLNNLSVGMLLAGMFIMCSCQKNVSIIPPAPTVNAGTSQTITLPIDTVTLTGSAYDSSSKITAYLWSEVSGPNVPVIADDGSASTKVSGLVAGTYVFQLMATDLLGATGVDTVSVTVSAGLTTLILHTTFPEISTWPFELTLLANSANPAGNDKDIELLAETWTINGVEVYGRSYFEFNMTSIPANTSVKTATLVLFSDTLPQNGNLIDANYGTTNDFWIQRVSGGWSPTTTNFNNQPAWDSAGAVHVPQTNLNFLNLSLDVTTMVNNMIVNGNNGFVMRLNTEQIYNSRIFCSSNYSDSTRHPYLVVTY
jgi:hypothetical protein